MGLITLKFAVTGRQNNQTSLAEARAPSPGEREKGREREREKEGMREDDRKK